MGTDSIDTKGPRAFSARATARVRKMRAENAENAENEKCAGTKDGSDTKRPNAENADKFVPKKKCGPRVDILQSSSRLRSNSRSNPE